MKELRLPFTDAKLAQIARGDMEGYAFWGAMHKTWSGLMGDGRGLELADVEVAADMIGVYDETLGYMDKAA